MSYLSSLKLYCAFGSSAITNAVSTLPLTTFGTLQISSTDWGNALQLKATVNAECTDTLAITNAFSLGFWLLPVNLGMVNQSGTLVPLNTALVANSAFSNYYTPGSGQFVVYETTNADGTNSIRILLKNGSTNPTFSSPSYSTGVWHHFVIAYSGATNTLQFYIDGILASTIVESTVPSTLSTPSVPFWINGGAPGTNQTAALSTAKLAEVFVANVAINAVQAGRITGLGVDYVFDSVLSTENEIDNTATFDDIETIAVNAMYSDESELYVGRSDGSLVKCYRSLWQVRRSFDSAEAALLEQAAGPQGTTYSITNGVLDTTTLVVRC